MTRNIPEWAYLVDDSGRCWHNLTDHSTHPAGTRNGNRPPPRAVYAIPSHDVVSIPHWVSSKDETIISEVVSVETERQGIKSNGGPGRLTDWKPVEHNGTRTLVQSVSIPWPLEDLESETTEFTNFVPQYALYDPPPNSVVLWKEGEEWVAGYSRGSRWVHVQALGRIPAATVLATEIELTMMELLAKGVIDRADCLVVWEPYDVGLHQALEEGTGLATAFEKRPVPSPGSEAAEWTLEPHLVSEARLARGKRKRLWVITACLLVIAALVVGGSIFHLWNLEQSNERLRQRIAANRGKADTIETAMEKWRALEPAIEPGRSPVELLHRITSLLPPRGFRLTSFELQDNETIVVRGEGANMAAVLKIKGALENASGLSDYRWEIPPPRSEGEITTFLATGTYRF